jgi:hypothetical protein
MIGSKGDFDDDPTSFSGLYLDLSMGKFNFKNNSFALQLLFFMCVCVYSTVMQKHKTPFHSLSISYFSIRDYKRKKVERQGAERDGKSSHLFLDFFL